MFRKTIFWTHLICGVTAGLVVLLMSVTGVLLTYERQILAWAAEHAHYAAPAAGAERQPIAAVLAAVKQHDPAFAPTTLALRNDPRAPLVIAAGRNGTLLVDPYTAVVAGPDGAQARRFFDAVTGWHRWFNLEGESRQTARVVTGASNLAFLFLVLSGIYLWLPRMWKWALFRSRLTFNAKASSSKARDFNWHHVFGIWSSIPLTVIVASAVVFSYPWANALVYRSVGEEPPVRGARGPGAPAGAPQNPARQNDGGAERVTGGQRGAAGARNTADWGSRDSQQPLPYEELFARAATQIEGWRTLTLNLPTEANAATVRFGIDQGDGGQPQLRHTLTLDASTGEVREWAPFSSQSTGQMARSWIRFLHTGEALGLAGQTIAGIVSFTSVLMVWTGLALAYRRLIVPLLARTATPPRA